MAYAMTKCGSLDNCVTYEFICDTIADMNAIENQYRTIGTVAIVLTGESEGLEVYITGSNKQWNSLSAVGGGSSELDGGLEIYICGQNDISNGLPNISEPSSKTIYLVPSGNTTGNLYEEYIYVDDAWEKFGSASIDLSNYIQKTDIATQSTAGLVKVLDNGNVTFNENNQLVLTLAGTAVVKTGQSDHPISVTHQHEAAFYGLAKAAGQDMKNSGNAVGTYTTEAASAIRNMIGAGTYSKPNGGIPAADLEDTYLVAADISGLAPKASPEFTGTISLGRKSDTYSGNNSVAIGYNNTASGSQSVAVGSTNQALGSYSHAEGYYNSADGTAAHVEGQYNKTNGNGAHAEGSNNNAWENSSHAEGAYNTAIADRAHVEGGFNTAYGVDSHVGGRYSVADNFQTWPTWTANTEYAVGDKVKRISTAGGSLNYPIAYGYICKEANSDASFTSSHWTTVANTRIYAEIIGNGTGEADNKRSNARALTWEGDEKLAGDLYVHANADSTGGTKVATMTDISGFAPINSPNFTGSISLGRKSDTTTGLSSVALGRDTTATGSWSVATGDKTVASGTAAHAEGQANASKSYINGGTTYHPGAIGDASHAEGASTYAVGTYSHAEGSETVALGYMSHSEGENAKALGRATHAEGYNTQATNTYAHAEGNSTLASGFNSHAEGQDTIASSANSHAEGVGSASQITSNFYIETNIVTRNTATAMQYTPGSHAIGSHSEGYQTCASGAKGSHAEGINTYAAGAGGEHTEGQYTIATGGGANHAEGIGSAAQGSGACHAEGYYTNAGGGSGSHAEGSYTLAYGGGSQHAEGSYTMASGASAEHAEGLYTQATGSGGSHAEGVASYAVNGGSHAEGYGAYEINNESHVVTRYGSVATGQGAHAEGYSVKNGQVTASGRGSHAEGSSTNAGGDSAHAEGFYTQATGDYAHAEGYYSLASAGRSHAEGDSTVANAYASHAEGSGTAASGNYSHAQGCNTQVFGNYSSVLGKYNIADKDLYPTWAANTTYAVGDCVLYQTTVYECKTANTDANWTSSHWRIPSTFKYAEIVGNGTGLSAGDRSNARALDWQGNEYLNGTLYINCNRDSTGGSAVATEATVTALTARVAALEAEIASLTAALQAFLVPANAVTMENGQPMTDENGNYIEFDVPTT